MLTPQILTNEIDPDNPPILRNVNEVTRDNLDRSRIKDQKRDELQKEILEPLYPEMRQTAPEPKVKSKGLSAVEKGPIL
jgi:hypothetical protein